MKCHLCEKPIKDYDSNFNHLIIDDTHEVDVCQDCADKVIKWQSKICAVLFPTKSMKKRFGGEK